MPFSNVAFSASFGVGFDRIDPPEDTGEPHGSASGWQLPHYEKQKPKTKVEEAPKIAATAKPDKVVDQSTEKPKPKPKLKLVERDKTLDQDHAALLEAEIKALELVIRQDKILADQAAEEAAQALINAKLLKEQQEAEELMVMLLLAGA